ncbi:MAG TPA: prolyl oligopeptidase family serine peptidase [Parafilimonas sp.]|nr:prolyl oligopeptidase family serine peptidase [Parafilimonas sp.]
MKNVIGGLCALILVLHCSAQYHYPSTKTVDSSDTYFGVTYHDPYRWLESIETPEVETWFKQQAAYTDSALSQLNGRDELVEEWKAMDKLRPAVMSSFSYENGRLFYRKTMPGENVGKIYYRKGTSGEEQLLFDPTSYVPGKTLSVQYILPSYDGKKLAIAYSEQGAELSVVKFIDVDSKQFLKDSLYPTLFFGGAWAFDNNSFLYGWIKSADSKDPASRLNPKTKLHKLGTEMSDDIDYLSNASYPELHIDPSVYPFVFVSEDSKNYVFGGAGSVQPEFEIYYAPIGEFNNQKINWKVLAKPADKLVRSFVVKDDDVYAITYNNAKNYKVIATSLKNPDWNNSITIAAENPDRTIEGLAYSKDYLFITYSDGINNYLSKYDFATKKTSDVKLPFSGTVGVTCFDTKSNDCLIGITSWTKPYTEFNYNAETDAFTPSSFNKPVVYPKPYQDLVAEEVQVKGHDGVMIPLSIIHKKGINMDGSNVCFMDSYGAYGSSMTPYFSVRENSLAVRGVVVAIPHVRGGSEKGEEWYRAGYKTTKPNTWKDFISCAEYLIDKHYTSPQKLAGTGTSAGGILISRAVTERPDLFAAAICNVGCANAMRLEFGANGPVNIPEFGTVKDSAECRALYEMDGMQHVVKGTKYPAVLCVGGWNDPRVVAWEPGKFAAALQNASTSGKPVFLKINYDNGHFTEDKSVTFANFANQYAFVLWQCGHPDFQPKKPGQAPYKKL